MRTWPDINTLSVSSIAKLAMRGFYATKMLALHYSRVSGSCAEEDETLQIAVVTVLEKLEAAKRSPTPFLYLSGFIARALEREIRQTERCLKAAYIGNLEMSHNHTDYEETLLQCVAAPVNLNHVDPFECLRKPAEARVLMEPHATRAGYYKREKMIKAVREDKETLDRLLFAGYA